MLKIYDGRVLYFWLIVIIGIVAVVKKLLYARLPWQAWRYLVLCLWLLAL